MAVGEFDLIRSHFAHCGPRRADVVLGIGDDAALLQPPQGRLLAVTTDTLVNGVHFFPDTDFHDLGWKALAVNLSDLAAMGAQPAWLLLAATLPQADGRRLQAFADGLAELAEQWNLALVGGDTTRGPLSFTLQVIGFVEPSRSLRRDAARLGDEIYVTGTLGDAALALERIREGRPCEEALLRRLHRPTPRVDEGLRIAGLARCGQDISDGLLADLGHICEASGVGARLELDQLPMSGITREHVRSRHDWTCPLSVGDDYELVFALSPAAAAELVSRWPEELAPITRIGEIKTGAGIDCRLPGGRRLVPDVTGHDHFRP